MNTEDTHTDSYTNHRTFLRMFSFLYVCELHSYWLVDLVNKTMLYTVIVGHFSFGTIRIFLYFSGHVLSVEVQNKSQMKYY